MSDKTLNTIVVVALIPVMAAMTALAVVLWKAALS